MNVLLEVFITTAFIQLRLGALKALFHVIKGNYVGHTAQEFKELNEYHVLGALIITVHIFHSHFRQVPT